MINQYKRKKNEWPVRVRLLATCLTLIAVASCASNPRGVLLPVSERVQGTTTVEMLVATTRDKSLNRAELFSGGRSQTAAYADITVSIPPANVRTTGEVQWPRRLPGNPATDFVTLRADIINQDEALRRLNRIVSKVPQRNVLVFVHGFNNRFEDAVFRFAQIVNDSGTKVAPVLFTWPSRGSIFAYGYDRESANFSRDALEEVLTQLSADKSVGEISILAHSMGNWVTLEALRQMAIRHNGRLAPKIANVMLAAPDVDIDVFQKQIAQIQPSTKRNNKRAKFTIFTSRDDRALALSRRLWGSTVRLGEIDPEVEPFKSELSRDDIFVVDMTGVQSADRLNHGTFAQSPEVVQLIGMRLAGGQMMTDTRMGLGDHIIQLTAGAAASVGTAAGLVLAAPVAVLDPYTRDNYGNQIGELGETISKTAKGH